MTTYIINIPITTTYTFNVDREAGLTKEQLLSSISDDELSNGDLEEVGWGEVKHYFLKKEVDVQDEEGNDIA